MISLSKLLVSIAFTLEEKEAIINGELAGYLQRKEMAELEALIGEVQPKSSRSESFAPNVVQPAF